MADSHEEIHKSIKRIKIIGLVLAFFTIVTVWLSTVELPTHSLNILVGMIVATFKAGLVALIFMHLNHEAKLIYKILAFTAAFAIALFFLFVFSASDPLVFPGFYESNQ
ncbi:cytochrome C oxidase subunit IV family protein [Prosthecobacter sp. SYSU 5D2]|uniref:cytochrome C oxidase subunit IV family protein n=1 Tax=Prosthecobacter sp. SYSU 5D2 TaxID=3134134 RepID=UPI0031FEC783